MRVVRGNLISFSEELRVALHIENGAIAIDGGARIAWIGRFADLPSSWQSTPVDDYGNQLVMPGLIDAHIHFPQYRMLAAPGKDLLDWLKRFTFPEEARYADKFYAENAAAVFLQRLHAHGTTAAMAFCSVHKTCTEALFSAAKAKNMAIVTGKTMMDRNAIAEVQDTAETSALETRDLYHAWHRNGRARYAVTPRFAITSTEAQLKIAGEVLAALPGAMMQTHISESAGEIALVQSLFPWAKDYADVYDHYRLVGPNSIFAHGIHLGEREARCLSEAGSSVIHCPTSNTFLGSGLMSMTRLRNAERPVGIGLATDVGGGTSYSMLATMGEAYKVQMLQGFKPKASELFAMSTIGNAKLLQISDDTGSLAIGKFADIVVIDPEATPVLKSRNELSESLEDMLFALMILGDDRAISATYVAGQCQHQRFRLGS